MHSAQARGYLLCDLVPPLAIIPAAPGSDPATDRTAPGAARVNVIGNGNGHGSVCPHAYDLCPRCHREFRSRPTETSCISTSTIPNASLPVRTAIAVIRGHGV